MSRATLELRTMAALGAAAMLTMTALAGAAGAPARDAAGDVVALMGGTVHTVSGETIPKCNLVIVDGKIAAVGPRVDAPRGAHVVFCEGKHVYPGMISPNTVLGLTEVGSVTGTNDWQETGAVNPNIRAEVGINPESEIIQVTRVNGVTSALVVPRGEAIAGTSALVHLDGWTQEDMTLLAPAGLHVIWPNMTPVRAFFETRSDEEQGKARDAAIDAIRRAFDEARAYWTARDAEATKGIPRHDRDVKWDAMGKALRGEIPVMFHASTLAQIRAALRFADEQKLSKLILVGGGDAWRIAGELKARDIAVICGPALALPSRRYEPYDEESALPAKLQAAGVRFCISDGGGAFTAPNARNLPYQASMAAAFGLPADEALKAVTLYPAQIFGVADRLGSIEAGKVADLVVANGDLLEIATSVEQVYINGRLISMENRQSRLFDKYDRRPRGPKARKR